MISTELAGTDKPAFLDGFQDYFRSSPIGLFVVDNDSRFQQINQRACEIFGYDHPGDAIGTSLSQLEFFFSQPIIEQINRLLENGESIKIDSFPGTNLAGHFANYCLACNRAHDKKGDLAGIFGAIEDVSYQAKERQELKNRIDELSLLSQISQVVSSALDTEEVLKVILTGVTARQGLGFNRAFLFLLDQESQKLNGRLAIGPGDAEEAGKIWGSLEHDDRTLLEILSLYQEESVRSNRNLTDLIRDMTIDISDGSLFSQVMRERQPIVVEKDTQLDRATERFLEKMGEKQAAMTPLVSLDRPIGLLVVDNVITNKEISEQDQEFLKLIADQTAAAVERSYLYQDVRERALELEKCQ
jgi:PAS domain S-box-containing protein